MSNYLLVPLHLDALYVENGLSVLEPSADFSKLPHFNGEDVINPDIANVSEKIVSKPFNNQNLHLPAGLHLHWALPDALTHGREYRASAEASITGGQLRQIVISDRGSHYTRPPKVEFVGGGGSGATAACVIEEGRVVDIKITNPGEGYIQAPLVEIEPAMGFPAVPNRWLVIRYLDNNIDEQWVVESDYLGKEPSVNNVSYPVDDQQQPFRFIGRTRKLQEWKTDGEASESDYLERLTAAGYGEPAFAAFYPNCQGVFGFHDAKFTLDKKSDAKLEYTIMGWYSRPGQDCLQAGVIQQAKTNKDKVESLESKYKWRIFQAAARNGDVAFPEQSIYFAHIGIEPDGLEDDLTVKPVSVSVGNTTGEALAALLAEKMPGDNHRIEDQIEALQFGSRLDGQKADLGFKFKESRHEKEFVSVPSGRLWTIRLQSEDSGTNSEDSLKQKVLGACPRISPAGSRYF